MSNKNRTIVIGDVHGCIDELTQLLKDVEHKPAADRLVFAGDLVDRGPDSHGVVALARKLGAEAVMGNHEEKHLRYARHEDTRKSTGKKNPMHFSERRIEEHRSLTTEDMEWLASLPALIRLDDNYVVVHGGFECAYEPIEKQDPKTVCRIRWLDEKTGRYPESRNIRHQPPGTVDWTAMWKGPEHVIYGHIIHSFEAPRIDEPVPGVFCYGIDTGVPFGGKLTAIILHDGSQPTFVSVQARRQYYKPFGKETSEL